MAFAPVEKAMIQGDSACRRTDHALIIPILILPRMRHAFVRFPWASS
jgi:hypothetical protein